MYYWFHCHEVYLLLSFHSVLSLHFTWLSCFFVGVFSWECWHLTSTFHMNYVTNQMFSIAGLQNDRCFRVFKWRASECYSPHQTWQQHHDSLWAVTSATRAHKMRQSEAFNSHRLADIWFFSCFSSMSEIRRSSETLSWWDNVILPLIDGSFVASVLTPFPKRSRTETEGISVKVFFFSI